MKKLPRVVRLYIHTTLTGMAIGTLFAMALVMFNVANLRHLIDNVEGGWLAFFLLCFFNGIVFSGVQFALVVMGMARKPGDGDDDVTGPPQP